MRETLACQKEVSVLPQAVKPRLVLCPAVRGLAAILTSDLCCYHLETGMVPSRQWQQYNRSVIICTVSIFLRFCPEDSRDEAEGPLLQEEEAQSDLASFQPTDSDVPSFLEDCNRVIITSFTLCSRAHLSRPSAFVARRSVQMKRFRSFVTGFVQRRPDSGYCFLADMLRSVSGQAASGDPPGPSSSEEHRQCASFSAALHRLHPRQWVFASGCLTIHRLFNDPSGDWGEFLPLQFHSFAFLAQAQRRQHQN